MTVAPDRALPDAPLRVRVSGLRPRQSVALQVRANDARGSRWSTEAAERADGRGAISIDAAPLLPAMRPQHASARALVPPRSGLRVDVRAVAGGRVLASGRQTRVADVRSRLLRPARDGLYGTFFASGGAKARGPAVLTLGGSGGGLSTAGLSALLAAHGHPSLALAYFKEPGLPSALDRIPLEYFTRALRWLRRQPGVDTQRIVVLGVSRGSEAALLLGARFPRLVRAVVGYVPSSYVHPAPIPTQRSWTLDGRVLPAGAPIPVARVRGPILVLSANDDTVWHSSLYARLIARRSGAEWHDFASAGHLLGIALPYATYVCPHDRCPAGGTQRGNAAARRASWAALLRFLAAL